MRYHTAPVYYPKTGTYAGTMRYPVARNRANPRRGRIMKRAFTRRLLSTVLPPTWTCKMRYVEQFNLNADNTGQPSYQVWKCDGCYDPNLTGTGHQPLGWDQMMGMYKKFQVLSSKIVMSPCVDSPSSLTNCSAYGISTMTTTNEIGGSTLSQLMENDCTNHKVRIVGGLNSLAWNISKGNSITHKWSAKKWYGKNYIDDADHQGTSSADPTQVSYFACWACAPTAGTDPTITQWIAQITYIVKFTDPTFMSQS